MTDPTNVALLFKTHLDSFSQTIGIYVVIELSISLRFASLSTKRKRCEGGRGVKPDDVISSLGTRQTASSKRHFLRPLARPSVLILLFSSASLR